MDSNFKILDAMVVMVLCFNISNIAIITVDYQCIIHNISKSEAIISLESAVLKNVEYIQKHCFNFQSIQESFFNSFCIVYIKRFILCTSGSL